MTTTLNLKRVNIELNWVIKVVKSVKTKEQLDGAFKCFVLWSLKYSNSVDKESYRNYISSLKSKFWSEYKNKESKFLVR
jgi:hypothetical protein